VALFELSRFLQYTNVIANSQTENQTACHYIDQCDERETWGKRMCSIIEVANAGLMFGLLTLVHHELAIACLLLGSGFLYAYYPAFGRYGRMMLSEAAAAATFGLINSVDPWRRSAAI
jgi:hypothetical protein